MRQPSTEPGWVGMATRKHGRITLRGLLVVLVPIVVVGKSIQHAHKAVGKTVGEATSFLGEHAPSQAFLDGTGFAIGILLVIAAACWVLGWLVTRTDMGKRLLQWEETVFLKRSPLLSKFVPKPKAGATTPDSPVQPALAHVAGGWQPGVIIEEEAQGWFTVFVPEIPSTSSGRLFYLLPEQVRRLDVPLEDFHQTLTASGRGSRAWLTMLHDD